MLWTLDDDRDDGVLVVRDPYFETVAPVASTEDATSEEEGLELDGSAVYTWNHGIGEVISSVLDAGLTLAGFVEHDTVPWDALGAGSMTEVAPNEWTLAQRPERLPHSYTLQATKPE